MQSGKIAIGRVADPNLFLAVWPDVERIIEARGKDWLDVVTPEEVWRGVVRKIWDLWLGTHDRELEMVGLCGWESHDKRSFYHIIWLGGYNLDRYMEPALRLVEQYASLAGAHEVVATGRYGWMRLLKDEGFLASTIQMRKNVTMLTRH